MYRASFIGEGEQGPALAGAPRDVSAGPRTMRRPRGAGPQRGEPRTGREPAHGSVSGVRLAHFGALAMCGAKRIVTRKRLIILEVTQYGHSRIFDY